MYVGIDIGGTNLKAGLVSERGEVLATQKMKVAEIADAVMLARIIYELCMAMCAEAGNLPPCHCSNWITRSISVSNCTAPMPKSCLTSMTPMPRISI